MNIKKRLDLLVQEQMFLRLARTQIQSLIMQGKVTVDGRPCTKAGVALALDAGISVTYQEPQYVCRCRLETSHML